MVLTQKVEKSVSPLQECEGMGVPSSGAAITKMPVLDWGYLFDNMGLNTCLII